MTVRDNPSGWINKVQRLEAQNDDEFNGLQLCPNLIKPPLSGVAPIFWFPNLSFLGVFLWLTKTPKHIGIFPIHILESLPANEPRILLMSRIWWISCFGLGREIRWWGGCQVSQHGSIAKLHVEHVQNCLATCPGLQFAHFREKSHNAGNS